MICVLNQDQVNALMRQGKSVVPTTCIPTSIPTTTAPKKGKAFSAMEAGLETTPGKCAAFTGKQEPCTKNRADGCGDLCTIHFKQSQSRGVSRQSRQATPAPMTPPLTSTAVKTERGQCVSHTDKGHRCTRSTQDGCGNQCKQHFDLSQQSRGQSQSRSECRSVSRQATPAAIIPSSTTAKAERGQCVSHTDKGHRCTRSTQDGCGNQCKQHFEKSQKNR